MDRLYQINHSCGWGCFVACTGRTLPRDQGGARALAYRGHDEACVASKNAIFLHFTRTKMAFPKEALAHFCPGQEVAPAPLPQLLPICGVLNTCARRKRCLSGLVYCPVCILSGVHYDVASACCCTSRMRNSSPYARGPLCAHVAAYLEGEHWPKRLGMSGQPQGSVIQSLQAAYHPSN